MEMQREKVSKKAKKAAPKKGEPKGLTKGIAKINEEDGILMFINEPVHTVMNSIAAS